MEIYRNTTYDKEYLNRIELPELISQLERFLEGFLLFLKEENLDVEKYTTSLNDTLQSKLDLLNPEKSLSRRRGPLTHLYDL